MCRSLKGFAITRFEKVVVENPAVQSLWKTINIFRNRYLMDKFSADYDGGLPVGANDMLISNPILSKRGILFDIPKEFGEVEKLETLQRYYIFAIGEY